MDKIINYMIDNNILVLAFVGGVFALLTTVLLITSIASNNKTKKQLRLISRSLLASQRPKVIPKFTTIEGRIKCLTFENIGGGYAKNIKIELNKEWLDAKSRLTEFSANNAVLNNLDNYSFYLAPKDSLSYGLFVASTESYEINTLKNQELQVILNYQDTNNVVFKELFKLELITHEGTIESAQTELMRVMRDGVDKIDALRPAIAKLEPAVQKIEPAISSFTFAVNGIEPAIKAVNNTVREMDAKFAGLVELYKDTLQAQNRLNEITENIAKAQKQKPARATRRASSKVDLNDTTIVAKKRGRKPKNQA